MLVAHVAEQPWKLAFMRGQHDLGIAHSFDRFKQAIGRVRETRQRIGVKHKTPARGERGMDKIDRARTDARAGADHDGIEAFVGQVFGELDRGVDGPNHHGGQRRGIDGERIPGRSQRDKARARPQRRAGR